jgi:putative ABC transport system permease protein
VGSAPAVLSARADVALVLRNGSRSVTGGGARLRSALVVSQIGLTLLLLVGAGLVAQTFPRLRDQESGFRADGLLVVRATNDRSGTRLQRAAMLSQFHEQVLERLRRLPGVLSAAGPTACRTRERTETARGRRCASGVRRKTKPG